MRIREKNIGYYVTRLKTGKHFSFAGYSDAEWYCMMGIRIGNTTGLGQVLDQAHGDLLTDVMKRRSTDASFLFAVPKCIQQLPEFADNQIDQWLDARGISITAYERDMVTDDLARNAGLFPLIRELQSHNVTVISNAMLRKATFLNYKHFIEITTPNLHLEDGGIKRAVDDALDYGKSGVYLVSAGVSAAVIIDQLHQKVPNSFFIDCGSIWDGFVGIGGQREWRAELYQNKKLWNDWIVRNIYG